MSNKTSIQEIQVYEDSYQRIDVIRKLIEERSSCKNPDDAFFAMDMGYMVQMVNQWKQLLPRVHPFYAVKANPDPILLHLMKEMNFGFDCASMGEIETIVATGTHPSKIIYAHTRKQPSHLKYAAVVGVEMTTFDDEDELIKIKEYAPSMKLLIRLSTAGFSNSQSEGMTKKFGCPIPECNILLKKAKTLGLSVKGVSFHVGNASSSPDAFSRAIQEAKQVFLQGYKLGFEMKILDIGGGFPCKTTTKYCTVDFEKVAKVVHKSLNDEFPVKEWDHINIIAEPGLCFSMPSTVLVSNIIGKRDNTIKRQIQPQINALSEVEYFINDGNQSSFFVYNLTTGVTPVAMPVQEKYTKAPVLKCKVWGQTCDEDVVLEECELPDMNVGDWIFFTDKGAYSAVYNTSFNGFSPRPLLRYISQSNKEQLDALISKGAFF